MVILFRVVVSLDVDDTTDLNPEAVFSVHTFP